MIIALAIVSVLEMDFLRDLFLILASLNFGAMLLAAAHHCSLEGEK